MPNVEIFHGDELSGIGVFNQRVDLWVKPDVVEIKRRARGDQPILGSGLVRALSTMPLGQDVPLAELDGLVIGYLDELVAADAVTVDRGRATRRASPPLYLCGITKIVYDREDAHAVTLLRTPAPRILIAPRPLARWALRSLDRDVGVAEAPEQPRLLRPPGRRHVRPSWQRWLITETAFDIWV